MQLKLKKGNMSVQNLVEILVRAIESPENRRQLIAEFQNAVWNRPKDDSWESVILDDLAYDLDFYQPNAALRSEDPSYINDEQAILEIRAALEKLRESLSITSERS